MSNNTLLKLKATADILGGAVFFANESGFDPEYPGNGGLLANGMYIRLEGSDGSIAYISAYELDKALDIISDMSTNKANQSDVDALQQLIEGKASDVDIELLRADVAEKATKLELENALDTIGLKADQTVVDTLIETVNDKASQDAVNELIESVAGKASQEELDALITTVNSKASSAEIAGILSDIATLQETVQFITNSNSITAINNQIEYLNNELKKKLTVDDLRTINTNINTLNSSNAAFDERLSNVEVNLNKKATTTYVQGQVNELNTAVTNISKRVDNKADKSDVLVKANKSDLDTVVKKVTNLTSTLTGVEAEIDDNYNTLAVGLNKKVDKAYVDTNISTINTALNEKTDKSVFSEAITRINTKLTNIENTQNSSSSTLAGDIEELECEFNNIISELRSTINTQARQITQQDTKITKLQDSSNSYSDQLKQSWVRVLTSRDYKNLRSNPPEGPYNARYKYPYTVYLVVDFNKPKALYIGDIMIAQAEQKGSIGFAYTFPIVF